jgi:glyoxylase-like metal-dependent hydrolase (beta-lactamase superfamily II)
MIPRRTWPALGAALLGGLVAAAVGVAQQDMSKVEVRTEKLADDVWVLYGAGGNIGLCSGQDGALLVDDQYAPLSPKILAAVKSANDAPLRWVVNTHWHGDHVGGNENMANAGALLIAQDRVRQRMLEGQENKTFDRKVDPAPAGALPTVTFNDSTTLHVNGEDAVVFHVAPAHTDGDAIVWFPRANVVHMGDTFFSATYPIIDLESGGSIDGLVAASERVLARIGDATKVIPGHGKVSDKAGLQSYHDMLVGVRAAVVKLVKQKKSLDEVVAARPTAPWDDAWGKGFMKPDFFTKLLYTELSAKKH